MWWFAIICPEQEMRHVVSTQPTALENQLFAGRREEPARCREDGSGGCPVSTTVIGHDRSPPVLGFSQHTSCWSARPEPCHVGLTAALGGGRRGAHFTDREPEAQGRQRALGSTVTTHRASPTRKASHPHTERQPRCRVCLQRQAACRTDPQRARREGCHPIESQVRTNQKARIKHGAISDTLVINVINLKASKDIPS